MRKDEILRRLARLERSHRRRKLVIVAIVVPLLALAGTAAEQERKIVEAEQFVLRDAEGRKRAELAVLANGTAGLFLYNTDQEGHSIAGLAVDTAGGRGLFLRDDDGNDRIGLQVAGDGNPNIVIPDNKISSGIGLGMFAGDHALLRITRPGGRSYAHLAVNPAGEDQMTFQDQAGINRLRLWTSTNGNAGLGLHDKEGGPQLTHQVWPGGAASSLDAFGPEGKIRLNLTATAKGDSGFWLLEGEKNKRLTLDCLPDGSPALAIYGDTENIQVNMFLFPEGTPQFLILDKNRKIFLRAPHPALEF